MFKFNNNKNLKVNLLYNKILFLSRNKLFYSKFNLDDTFQNRINLIFFHVCFLFITLRVNNNSSLYKDFFQKMFDFIFRSIEIDMRETGYGDTTINKNMKFVTRVFYTIMMNCEKFSNESTQNKNLFLSKHLSYIKSSKNTDYSEIIDYFDSFIAFCFDLDLDSVISGNLKFEYKKFI